MQRPQSILCRVLISSALIFNLTACQAQQESTKMAKFLPEPTAFNPKRTEFPCVKWKEPAIDANGQAERWYKAATLLQAEQSYKNTVDYLRMLYLYEGAARLGHWRAINNLIILYSDGGYSLKDQFPVENDKARYWIQQGIDKDWAIADAWVGNAYLNGTAGYEQNSALALAYIQRAANAGVPVAQYSLASVYVKEPISNFKIERQLLTCAAEQEFSAAAETLALGYKVDGDSKAALQWYHNAVSFGGKAGGEAAVTLNGSFSGRVPLWAKALSVNTDTERAKAYTELDNALLGTNDTRGNVFFKFPRLNEVLPLPPAKMPPWKGVYSAMSPEDAAYYQNPPNIVELVKEVIAAQLFKEDYITKPEPIKF